MLPIFLGHEFCKNTQQFNLEATQAKRKLEAQLEVSTILQQLDQGLHLLLGIFLLLLHLILQLLVRIGFVFLD